MAEQDEPLLGLATTEELFRELIARLSDPFSTDLGCTPAIRRVAALAEMLGSLPMTVREYRAVDS